MEISVQIWTTTHAQAQILIFKDEEFDWIVATAHFVVQKLLTLKKEEQLHTQHGIDAFSNIL